MPGHPPSHRTHSLGHPLGPIAPPPNLGKLDGEGTARQVVAELRDQVARPYLQLLKFSFQLMPLALATLQLLGHGAMVQGGGGSRSVARQATSTPRPPAHSPPPEVPAVPAEPEPEPRAHLTSRTRPGGRPTPRGWGRRVRTRFPGSSRVDDSTLQSHHSCSSVVRFSSEWVEGLSVTYIYGFCYLDYIWGKSGVEKDFEGGERKVMHPLALPDLGGQSQCPGMPELTVTV